MQSKNIAAIIGNQLLASAIHSSVTCALRCPFVRLVNGNTVWSIFKHSLDAAIRKIETHSRGKLFRRLIEYGPRNPDDPETLNSDDETILSDPECGSCVEFIYSYMINRFKGELAELLALEPCIELIQQLHRKGRLPSGLQLFWGETIQERRKLRVTTERRGVRWGDFAKGADGLLVKRVSNTKNKSHEAITVLGVAEVKSMTCSKRKIHDQINKHVSRLNGGVKLGKKEWISRNLLIAPFRAPKKSDVGLLRVMILPSTWKLSREWKTVKTDKGRTMVFPEPSEPSKQTESIEVEPNFWKITLAWSQEVLNQAAYEMTFWYMSQVGRHVYTKNKLPKGWEYMTPEQAGYNAIKMMLYYIPLRYISKRQGRLATRLYNVYCFGYPLGVDSDDMLWPEDFPCKDEK